MPINLSWDESIENTTRLNFTGLISLDELFMLWEQEAAMQREIDGPVYSLNYFENVSPSLRGVSMKRLMDFVQSNKPDNLQMTVQVAGNGLIRRSLMTIAATMPHKVYVVKTLDAGYAIIRENRTELKRLKRVV